MSQIYNPNTHLFVKRDKEGKFVSAKETPYATIPLAVAKGKKAGGNENKPKKPVK